jgi:NADPH:quinone reductase and related Zn-dependent oxidoreductases
MSITNDRNGSSQEIKFPLSFPVLAHKDAGQPVTLQSRQVGRLAEDEVLVRVEYASLNAMDAGLALRNAFQLPLPYVLGFDFSGEVAALGTDHPSGLKPGDPVYGSSLRGGCFGHYVVVKNHPDFIRKRTDIPSSEASTYGIAFRTAYEALCVSTDLSQHKGKLMYVAGAGGGLGHFAVQIAKLKGLKVIGSAGKPATLQLLHELGLDAVIDYAHQDLVGEILKLTEGRGVDVVFDPTYKSASYQQSTAVIADGGEYIRLASDLQLKQFGLVDLKDVVITRGASLTIADLARYTTDPEFAQRMHLVTRGVGEAEAWYKTGALRPHITQVIPFEADALQTAMDDFRKGIINVGKVVLEVDKAN